MPVDRIWEPEPVEPTILHLSVFAHAILALLAIVAVNVGINALLVMGAMLMIGCACLIHIHIHYYWPYPLTELLALALGDVCAGLVMYWYLANLSSTQSSPAEQAQEWISISIRYGLLIAGSLAYQTNKVVKPHFLNGWSTPIRRHL